MYLLVMIGIKVTVAPEESPKITPISVKAPPWIRVTTSGVIMGERGARRKERHYTQKGETGGGGGGGLRARKVNLR